MSILGDIREKVAQLKWDGGLNREEMRTQWPNMPLRVFDLLPADYRFGGAGEVMSYFEHVMHHGAVDDLDPAAGEPPTSIPSTTVARMPLAPEQHGVGSGADPGYTGGGSVQTGVGREGTTYGDTEDEEPLPEEKAEEPREG